MATYKVKSPDGRTLTLRGETPPTESDLDEIFSSLKSEQSATPEVVKNTPVNWTKNFIKSQRGLTPVGFIPTSKDELTDIPKVIGRQLPGMRGQDINFLTQGPFGVGMNMAGIKKTEDVIPAPKTSYGKAGETAADLAQLFLLANEGASAIAGKLKSNPAKRFGALRNKTQKAQQLSQELLAQMEEARKTAGAMQGGYIEANADAPINNQTLKASISKLPQALQEEILSNPSIQKSMSVSSQTINDPAGLPIKSYSKSEDISPNLKNAETIRGLIKGKVPSSRWNPKLVMEPEKNAADLAYSELGKIMTEGRPELGEAMNQYAKVRQAEKQLEPMIRTRQGFIRTKPVIKAFGSGAEGVPSQAIEVLAEHNPDILKTVDNIRRFGANADRANKIKSAAKILGYGALTGTGASAGWSALKKVFGD